jgi:hypothetical protein
VPAEQTAEVIKDIDRKGEGEAVEVRPALQRREHRYDGNSDFNDNRDGEEHRD